MRWRILSGLVVVGTLFAAPSAWAGHPQERHGFWIGFGGGYGSADVSADCDECGSENREESFTGFFKLGGTLNQHVLLGVESNAWIKNEDDNWLTLGSVTGTVTIYPQASGGFFLKGGVGLSYLRLEADDAFVSTSASKTGWGVLAGIGYDLRVGSNVSLTPCVNFYYGKPGDLDFGDGDVLPGFKQNVVSFELGITFH